MDDSKPLASLSPTLLARKGGAKPAMRSQLHYPDSLARTITEDDLGWNDMGGEGTVPEVKPSGEVVPFAGAAVSAPAEKPPVRQQQEAVARHVRSSSESAAAERRSAFEAGRRAAFTLRVDADRHLKLRLACTIRNRSAQQLVTEALDRLLDELPDIATLAEQVAKRR